MGTYKVKAGNVEIECSTAEEAATLIARLGNGKAPEASPAPAPTPPPVEVFDRPGTGNRGVDALHEIEGAGRLVWDWLTSEKDPRTAILEALKRAGR